jgi:hypothetical protein
LMQVIGFKIWPWIGYWSSSWYLNKTVYVKTQMVKAHITRVTCVMKYFQSSIGQPFSVTSRKQALLSF